MGRVGRMSARDMLSLAEAGRKLNVCPEQVRRYLHRGLLPAAKIANAWVLPAAEVHALAEAPPRGGRPLSQAAAWRSILAGSVDFDDPCSYVNRGVLARYSGGSGMVTALLASPDLIVSGMHAAAAYVDLLDPQPDEAQVYIEEGWQQRADGQHPMRGLAPDPLGRVLVRALSSDNWGILRAHCVEAGSVRGPGRGERGERLVVPAAAVALDLCASPHPREQRVADAIIEGFG